MKKILGLVLALSFWGSTQAATIDISIEGFTFSPEVIDIKQGDTIRWTNEDSAPHLVQGNFGSSPNLNTGQTYEFTFNEAGNFDYICEYHPSMTGTVRVALSSEIAPPSSNNGALGTNDLFADFFETPPVPSQLEEDSSAVEVQIPEPAVQSNNEIQIPEVSNTPPSAEPTSHSTGHSSGSSVNNNPSPTVITPSGGNNNNGEFQSSGGTQNQSLAASGPTGFNWLWIFAVALLLGGYFSLVRR